MALEGELKSIRMAATAPEAEITAFTDAYQNALAGKKNVVTEVEGTLDPAAGAGDATIFACVESSTPVSLVFDPTGSGPAANSPEYQCTASGLQGALVTAYRLSLPVGGGASYGVTIQHSKATSRAVA